ncbi:Ankyrin repeat, PH and SEC7 domain containing protein secG [Colletotrichum siamense]|uniref:Ankyrin repeat, PH and SEC7 domain containing protein secG n=1 Tax=Colletotrichum siamense TaxID=690259 RepID=A0A9P5EQ97_COLSI|nr:Ankyrin repeat, PH and SEC7 domain containing protein secG [Colletotrichum siamense]
MSASRKLLLFFILLFARAVLADGGDDFANNLFSDLGPLLALFGERVTMQFMSGSMGWADNIILAMAPLGIITAIVGAIRVGGPSWLKAVIGRARENLAIAEAELMSSTSQEVCELWNGQEVVRCMGSPSVTEFICLLPKNGNTGEGPPEIEVFDPLKNADEYLEPIDLNIKDDFTRLRLSCNGTAEKDSEDSSMEGSRPKIIVKRNLSPDAPNISLNTHRQTSRGELRIVAAFGTILQLSVLIYSGFATYHPTLRFQKDDNPVASYAYPCTTVGTAILVVGMMLCAHVVESSTAEQRFQSRPGKNLRVRMVWLQQTKTVSDQVFESFAVYATDDQEFITTSRRSQSHEVEQFQSTKDDEDSKPLGAKSQSNHPSISAKGASITLQVKTVLGTMTCLTGFILQFVGLRGLHWSASIAQLGAVFLMVCLKAWVRRGLATPPNAISLTPGYELDWFAKTLGKVDQAPWNVERGRGASRFWDPGNLARKFDRKTRTSTLTQNGADDVPESFRKDFGSQWRIASNGSGHLGLWIRGDPPYDAQHDVHEDEQEDEQANGQDDEQEQEQSQNFPEAPTPLSWNSSAQVSSNSLFLVDAAVSDAQKVLDIRKDLGHLAKWRGPASSEAVSLARAIEITMNTLVGSSPLNSSANLPPATSHFSETFYWSLDACYDTLDDHPINFQIQRQPDGKWKAYANEYEAALSLWLSSVENEKGKAVRTSEIKTEHSTNKDDDARLRMEESKGELGLRLLGLHTTALRRDLRWWVPKDILRIFEVQDQEQPQRPRERQKNNRGDVLDIEPHRIIGYSQQKLFQQDRRIGTEKSHYLIRFSRENLPEETTDDDEDESAEDVETNTILATESYSSMPLLFAQHIFSAFMYALAGTDQKKELFKDVADVQPNTSGDSTWKSFTLRNATLSAMVLEIESCGLGNPADIYLSVIPPLSKKNKLPQADDTIIAMARERAEQHEQLQHWEEATKIYLWLFRTANTFKERGMLTKATAVLMEYLRQISSIIDLREAEFSHTLQLLKDVKKSVEEELNRSADHRILLGLMGLYAAQGREWECAAICKQGAQASAEENSKQLKEFNFTDLHRQILNNQHTGRAQLKARDIHHWTPLHYAARIRFENLVEELLDAGADVNSTDLNGYTPLHYACQFSMEMDKEADHREKAINKLIREGAKVNLQGRDGMAPLHCASIEGNVGIVSMLTEAGANIDLPDSSGKTPLLWAVRKGALSCAQNLWEFSNKRLRDNEGRTALHLAALSGMADVVEWLITQGGADKEARDRTKNRPLHLAAINGHEKIVGFLINKGAEKDVKDSSGSTPLHCAARNGHTHVLALLLKHGLGINDKNEGDSTALYHAAEGGHEEAVAFLIQQGADKDTQLTWNFSPGTTPLHKAAEGGYEKVVVLLIQHDAKPDVKDGNGATPLHKAIQGGHENIVKLLIGVEVDIEAHCTPDTYGAFGGLGTLTPLHLAAGYGHANIVRILMDAGAKTDVLDKDEPSRLALAVRGGHAEIAKQLLETGSDVHEPRNARIYKYPWSKDYNTTLLHMAVEDGDVEMA